MPAIIKSIAVKDKAEAVVLTDKLVRHYKMTPTDPDNTLDVTSEKLHVYYDAASQAVIVETNDAHSGEEYVKELLASFPTFF